MRINKFVASGTGLSRRAADQAIADGRVEIAGKLASAGDQVEGNETVTLDKRSITPAVKTLTIMLNKPVGYVCSRQGQGSQTVYDILPVEYQHLQTVGRLDKDSSGLLLLTTDGELTNQLTHPRYSKTKSYELGLDKPLEPLHQQMISDHGIQLNDGTSRLGLQSLSEDREQWQVTMSEGRNRQIRRTFNALGYEVIKLHRLSVGEHVLGSLPIGQFQLLI